MIFFLHYVWVRVLFLTANLHWRNRWTNSVILFTWRSGRSNSIFFKPLKLVSSLIISRLDYCNALLAGSHVLLDKIQRVINRSARLTCKAPKSALITPLFYDLHWLPISSRIQYKIALICFHIVSGIAPSDFSELLRLSSPPRSLRSASDTPIFRFLRISRRTLGRDPFNTSDLWSGTLFLCLSLSSFKSKLKPTSSLLHTGLLFSFCSFC